MEIKKSKAADLESGRTTNFLLGLIVVLATIFVGFEYSSNSSGEEDYDLEDADDIMAELELTPITRQERRIALMPKPQKEPTNTLKVVETDETETPNAEQLITVDGEGNDESKVEKSQDGDKDDSNKQPNVASLGDNIIDFRVVEQLPQFPGGAVEMMKWLTKTLEYPKDAQRKKKEGKVVAQFIVEKDGSISGLKVTKGVYPSLDREAMRVLKLMPNWKAGVQDDKPCRTMVCIPIVFKL